MFVPDPILTLRRRLLTFSSSNSGTALINSLSFLQLDNSVASLQNRLFTVFQGMFIAPGLLNQVQPRFIDARNLFEKREKLVSRGLVSSRLFTN